jgi:hypothetical protein
MLFNIIHKLQYPALQCIAWNEYFLRDATDTAVHLVAVILWSITLAHILNEADWSGYHHDRDWTYAVCILSGILLCMWTAMGVLKLVLLLHRIQLKRLESSGKPFAYKSAGLKTRHGNILVSYQNWQREAFSVAGSTLDARGGQGTLVGGWKSPQVPEFSASLA